MDKPQVPAFDRKSFANAPGLDAFFGLLRPFFDAVADALGSVNTPQVVARGLQATTDGSGALTAPVFVPQAPPPLLLVTAARLDAQGRETGERIVTSGTWKAATQGKASGFQVTALQGLAAASRYSLTVWGLSG